MSTKELLAVGLKLVGIFTIVQTVAPLVSQITSLLLNRGHMPATEQWREWVWMLAPVVELLFGVCLIVGSNWFTKLLLRTEAPVSSSVYTCKKCGGAFPAVEWEKATQEYLVPEGMLVCPNYNCTSLNDHGELKAAAHHGQHQAGTLSA